MFEGWFKISKKKQHPVNLSERPGAQPQKRTQTEWMGRQRADVRHDRRPRPRADEFGSRVRSTVRVRLGVFVCFFCGSSVLSLEFA